VKPLPPEPTQQKKEKEKKRGLRTGEELVSFYRKPTFFEGFKILPRTEDSLLLGFSNTRNPIGSLILIFFTYPQVNVL
jgi:hypothetical protein